jgi:hypothetical protein
MVILQMLAISSADPLSLLSSIPCRVCGKVVWGEQLSKMSRTELFPERGENLSKWHLRKEIFVKGAEVSSC